jgi:hypothetical protein
MARYSALLGRRVEVTYRAGDIFLPATGTLVGDSGKSVFLEEHVQQHGTPKNFRWEIPYRSIIRLEERSAPAETCETPHLAPARAREAVASGAGLLPLKNRAEEA